MEHSENLLYIYIIIIYVGVRRQNGILQQSLYLLSLKHLFCNVSSLLNVDVYFLPNQLFHFLREYSNYIEIQSKAFVRLNI